MQSATITRVLASYGYNAAKILPSEKGYRNESHPVQLANGTWVNVILYKNEPEIVATIHRIHAVSTYLAAHGFPVRHPLDERLVRARGIANERYLALYNYLPGHTIPWDAYTQQHLKLLGKTMSDMHAALQSYPTNGLPSVADLYQAIYTRMAMYFADDAVVVALQDKLGLRVSHAPIKRALRLLRRCALLPHQQALHMDFVRSNILFSESNGQLAVSGILDFEKVAVGHQLFDIARTLAFLLVDCKYKTPMQVRKYFLYSGYHKRGMAALRRVTVRDGTKRLRLLEELLDIFMLYDFYKFLKHNPYESLLLNEHFVRTRDLLLERGVISTTYMV